MLPIPTTKIVWYMLLTNILNNFKEKMGFDANQMIDYKAMIGDNSDNLPGVKGIGPKTALTLLQQYGSLENIIENIDSLKGKTKEAFESDAEVAKKTKFLATIYTEVPFEFGLDDILINKPNYHELRKFFEKVEFKSFLRKIEIEPTNIEKTNKAIILSLDNKSLKSPTLTN